MSEFEFWLVALLIIAILVFLLVVSIIYIFDSRVFDVNGKQLPGPTNHLWGDNFFTVLNKARIETKQLSKSLCEVFLPKCGNGNMVAFNVFGKNVVAIGDPEMAKIVLSGHHMKFPKSKKYDVLKFALGNGLVTSAGDIWQSHRQLISPGFQFESLKIMVSIFNNKAINLVNKWKSLLKGNKKIIEDLNQSLPYLTMTIITASAFGYNFEDHEDGDVIIQSIDIILEEMNTRLSETFNFWYYFYPLRLLKVNNALKKFNSLFDKIMDDRIEKYKNYNENNENDNNQSPNNSNKNKNSLLQTDLLDILLASNSNNILSRDDIRDHIMTFFGAGHETTSSTLLWTIYELCLNPHIQLKCQQEIDSIMNNNNDNNNKDCIVDYDDINKFVYINQVLQETMRLHPPVPGFTLKPKTEIIISTMAIHLHNDYWVSPKQFMPERFSPENVKETLKNAFQYFPFSAGPRKCIGQRFSIMETVIILVQLLSNFNFSLPKERLNDIKFVETIVYTPKNFKVDISMRF